MKKIRFFALILILFDPSEISAQISISVSTDQDRYIQFEPVEATVSLRNYSGQSISFANIGSQDGGYLKIKIINTVGRIATQIQPNLDPTADLVLLPGAMKSVTLNLSEFFDIQSEDDYELLIRVGHHRFEHDFMSNPVRFQVRNGVKIWSREVGRPTLEKNKRIKTKTYSLNTIHFNTGDLYFLQIEDDDYVYATIRLGPRVLGILPQCEIDALSRVHTLIQTAPRLLNYRIFDLDGDMKQNNFYVIEGTMAKLFRDPDLGTVAVKGGRKAAEGIDFNVKSYPDSNIQGSVDEIPKVNDILQ